MANVQRLQYGVDRIEGGGWVVLEDGDAKTFTVPRGWLPADVRAAIEEAIAESFVAGFRLVMIVAAALAVLSALAAALFIQEPASRTVGPVAH